MLSILKTKEGLVKAYIEWYVVGPDGNFQDNGQYIWINDCWIHPQERGKKALNKLIRLIDQDQYTENALWVYWHNHKRDRLSKTFSRDRLSKMGVKE